jgi:hypothetical protein
MEEWNYENEINPDPRASALLYAWHLFRRNQRHGEACLEQ